MTRPQAVVFDLYETLVTEFDPSWRARPTPADRLGIPPAALERVWQRRRHERMTSAVDFRDILREVSDHEDVIEELYRERLAVKAKPLNVEQAVLDVLHSLRSEALRLGLISDCSMEEVAAWDRSPLAPLFDEVVFSYQVGMVKPDPAIYALACDRLGVERRHAVFVGDGGSDELAGAQAAGMRVCCAGWFLDRWPDARSQPAARFKRLASPVELLDALL